MRRQFTLCSVVAHAVVITAALVSQQLAVGALPTPHQPVIFDAADITPVDIQLPRATAAHRARPDGRRGKRAGVAGRARRLWLRRG